MERCRIADRDVSYFFGGAIWNDFKIEAERIDLINVLSVAMAAAMIK